MEAGGRRSGTDLRMRSERRADGIAGRAFPSPLVGEGGSLTRSGSETDEGSVSAERTPHPPCLRQGTFSHKGRREEVPCVRRDDGKTASRKTTSRNPAPCGPASALAHRNAAGPGSVPCRDARPCNRAWFSPPRAPEAVS